MSVLSNIPISYQQTGSTPDVESGYTSFRFGLDGKIYKKIGSTESELATGGDISGSYGEIQINSGGSFASSPAFTFDFDTSALTAPIISASTYYGINNTHTDNNWKKMIKSRQI